jgi:structural maintenance of chromosome 4
MDGLKAQVMQNESNIQELKLSCAPIQKSIEVCQNQILEAGGTRFKAQRSKVNDLKDQIKLQEKRSSKILAQKVSLEKQISSGTSGANENNEISTLEGELKGVEETIEKLTIEAFQVKKEHENLLKGSEDFVENIGHLKKEQETISKELAKFRKREFELKTQFEAISSETEELKVRISHLQTALSKLEINSIKIDGEVEVEIPIFSREELSEIRSISQLESSIKSLEAEVAEMRPNLKVIQEYREKERIFKLQKEEFDEIERRRDENRVNYENLRKMRHEEFMSGFRQISLRLKELYQLITMGGNAELELVDSLDPFTEGILFSVMPPKKSWKNISNLSGGEKTLSSLALVFALHTFKPTPIYVMDEIDAALDFRNVSIVANYLKERTKDAQFIVISLRNNMFELADRLVGIYKTNQRTKSVTIDPKSFCIKSQ